MPPEEMSLGEVSRNLARLERSVGDMAATLTNLREGVAREIDIQIGNRVLGLMERVGRLEKLLYGAVALVLAAFLTAVSSLVIRI